MKEYFPPIALNGDEERGPYRPHQKTLNLIHLANEIIEELAAMGYRLTLRQLFYQLVSRDVLPNKQTEYKRLGDILNEARLGGMVDWDAIEDRTRHIRGVGHFRDPADVVDIAAESFRLDKWASHWQDNRVEVWVEKDAIVQILEKACQPLDVDYLSCRGYTSASAAYGASKRLLGYFENGQTPIIIHLGDHDPSGIDMTRDIEDRLNRFLDPFGYEIEIRRIALNMPQIRQYNPPPNPAKPTDSRYDDYRKKHGKSCWELDALNPRVIDRLITDAIIEHRNDDAWEEAVEEERVHRLLLKDCANRWEDVSKYLSTPPKPPRKKAKK